MIALNSEEEMVDNAITGPNVQRGYCRGRILLIAAACIALAMPMFGQSAGPALQTASSQGTVSQAMQFEVASIKPSKPGDGTYGVQPLPDGLLVTHLSLHGLVSTAYDIVTESQISGLPRWVDAETYDVDAKVDAKTAEAWNALTPRQRWQQQKLMLRSLLAERCQLKTHTETRELPVYDLVIAKSGVKMKVAAPNEESMAMISGRKMTAHAMIVKDVANIMTGDVGRLIVDKTGLGDKKFDFELRWTPDDQQGSSDAGPSIFTAFEEQLGLKLVSSRAKVGVLVIDHIEQPSAN